MIAMVTMTAEREKLRQIVMDLPDDKIPGALDFIGSLQDGSDEYEPNEETAAALLESEDIEKLPTYDTVEDMFNALGIKC